MCQQTSLATGPAPYVRGLVERLKRYLQLLGTTCDPDFMYWLLIRIAQLVELLRQLGALPDSLDPLKTRRVTQLEVIEPQSTRPEPAISAGSRHTI